MLERIRIPDDLVIQMEMAVQAAMPNEACGLLGGNGDLAGIFLPISNDNNSPTSFYMNPEEQLHAFLFLEAQQMEMQAIFHSHPNGPVAPSPSDIAQFYYPGTLSVIWSPGNYKEHLHAFHILPEGVREMPIIIEMSRNG
jgi:proteasome lid subunit RPN8/RPN11